MIRPGSQPLVSVCIQAYQHASYIRQCLDSVLNQETGFQFEIILGEDDSTDGTRDICIEYANRYPAVIRLFLRSERDKIYINAEKTGRYNFIENLKASSGKYIALLDGDDYWLTTGKLKKLAGFMEDHPDCSLSFHKTLHCVDNGEPFVREKSISENDSIFSIGDIIRLVNVFTIHTSNCMFARKNIDEIPEWFYKVPFLDVPLYVHNGQKGKIGYIAETMSVYRIHTKGMWLSKKEPMNYIKMWNMFSIMAENVRGDIRDVLIERRFNSGEDLVRFYKNHAWQNSDWLRKELVMDQYAGDDLLLRKLCGSPTIKNYFYNLGSYSKEIVRRFIK